jgi:hypothetical protein
MEAALEKSPSSMAGNTRIVDELLRHRNRLPRVRLAILKNILQWPPTHTAMRINLFQRQIESLLPLRPVLRVRPR